MIEQTNGNVYIYVFYTFYVFFYNVFCSMNSWLTH